MPSRRCCAAVLSAAALVTSTLLTSSATADQAVETPAGEVRVRVHVPDRVVGQRVVVRYDVRGDETDGSVRVVLRSPDGVRLDTWREPSYPVDGRIRVRLARTTRPGSYSVEVRWRGPQGSGFATTGVFFRVARAS